MQAGSKYVEAIYASSQVSIIELDFKEKGIALKKGIEKLMYVMNCGTTWLE